MHKCAVAFAVEHKGKKLGCIRLQVIDNCSRVYIAEGTGHFRDSIHILEASGYTKIISEDHLPFIAVNNDEFFAGINTGMYTDCRFVISLVF